MTDEQIKEVIDKVFEDIEMNILSFEDDWSRSPQRQFEYFCKNYEYAYD